MVNWLGAKFKVLVNLPLGFTILYLFFPTDNSGIDGYAYASAIKWGHELIWHHHLLYVPFGRFLFLIFPFIEPLLLMKIVNSLAAGIILMVLQTILKLIQINYSKYFVLFIGSCFGFMRFATENETYILPLLFSLIATFYFIKYLNINKIKFLIFSGLSFGIGVLFHQIHIFWYMGFAFVILLNIKSVKAKNALLFILSGGSLVLTVYLLTYYFYTPISENSFLKFVLHDVYAGQVNIAIGLNNFIMTPISFIRTFIQVHGYMKPMLEAMPVLLILPVAFLIIVFICLKSIIKYSSKRVTEFPILLKAIFWAFVLQFLFAFYSVGNAEFMLMLPVLIILWLVLKFDIPTKPVFYISLILLFWNIVFGLSPSHFLDLDGSKPLLGKIEKYPKAKWLLNEPQKMENMFDYKHGVNASLGKIIKGNSYDIFLINNIETLIKTQEEVFTDCIEREENLNRKSFLNKAKSSYIIKYFKCEALDSIEYFGGKKVIYKLHLRNR